MKTAIRFFSVAVLLLALASCSDYDPAPGTEFSITSVSPESGTVGTEVVITGVGFPEDAAGLQLTFGGAAAPIVSLTPTQITTSVPPGATSGEIRLSAGGVAAPAPGSFTVLSELVSATYSNLPAPQTGGQGEPVGGPFTRFSFETGEVTESETEWDVAFRGTTIAVNGGVATGTAEEPVRNGEAGATLISGLFDEVGSAAGLSFAQDAEGAFAIPSGSGAGWYNYNPATFTINPIPGAVLVFRTHDGKVAKVEILSYYRDAPAQPNAFTDEARFYTFRYVYNPNEGETQLK
jgi:hypothetical protein